MAQRKPIASWGGKGYPKRRLTSRPLALTASHRASAHVEASRVRASAHTKATALRAAAKSLHLRDAAELPSQSALKPRSPSSQAARLLPHVAPLLLARVRFRASL
eukprot:2415195-Rhodomonas_salina.1